MRHLTFIIAFCFLLGACKKVLDKNPVDSLTPSQAFSSEQNLQLYVNSFYQMLPNALKITGANAGTLEDYYISGDIMSDVTAWSQNLPYLTGGYTSKVAQGWDWGNLRNINYFLEHYRAAPVPDARKEHFGGIARFFRAWFYFDKVKRFGNVPWYGKVLTSGDSLLYKKADPRTLVMDSVLADINGAVQTISDKKDNSASNITKWVALALKSRICLFEGTFRKYHPELGLAASANAWLKDAADAAAEIMNSNLYSLVSSNNPAKDYRSLFISENPVSAEVMLAAVYNNNLKKWNNVTGFFSDYGQYQPVLIKRFMNTYLNIDGTPFTDKPGFDTIRFSGEVKGRDARLAQTIRTPGYKRTDGSAAAPYLGAAYTGYQILKFSIDDKAYDLNGQGYNSIPIIRYAEVLLNYAEAKAEAGDLTGGDWNKTIALLRQRAGITNTAMPATVDGYLKDNFYTDINSVPVMEIRRERAIELVAEGFRYDDLKRWKAAKLLEKEKDGMYVPEMNKLYDLNEDGKADVSFVAANPANPVAGVYYFVIDNKTTKLSLGDHGRILWQANMVRQFDDYKYFAPIPYNELLINPNLQQNAGWDHP
ncbi:RagB/SusD family nutrient uptake outer membrane protein [Niabella drilacis]|uniref:Starch-binding associating with outer membrane n=1 Tax=Niabella drilacis (strain DSM 25811 / CCM 8410 / CCUG 62505 / LMG 26954 / E90) TaxID=1285928 RepID=A0A1G6S6I7_NIADE|nr:RagB/SusD family nutrient uptake outer membrane protein [Niabella drilacis]SDD11747.1 Starch-binding associating with outer membrane [Niabella drilacis]